MNFKIKHQQVLFFAIISLLFVAGCQQSQDFNNQESSIALTYTSLSPQAKALYFKQSEELTKEVPNRLVELDQKQIGCFGPSSIMNMDSQQENLGGQCCGVLTDFEGYEVQLASLSEFIESNGNINFIPIDPYDIPVAQAKMLTAWDSNVKLSINQQAVFNGALAISHHGPCCCKCWKWYMMSGLGKKLITDHDWNSEQVAQLWDLSSSCGHDSDTNMNQHYSVDSDHSEH